MDWASKQAKLIPSERERHFSSSAPGGFTFQVFLLLLLVLLLVLLPAIIILCRWFLVSCRYPYLGCLFLMKKKKKKKKDSARRVGETERRYVTITT